MSESYLRTTFLERLAHDLRGAASTGGTALDEIETALAGTESMRFAQIARRSIAKVLRMSQSLADAADVERGAMVLTKADADVGELVRDAVEAARQLENRRGIELMVEGTARAACDGPRLKRAVFELVSNAIKAATSKVTVSIRSTTADAGDATARSASSRHEITVSDDGTIGCAEPVARFTPTNERRGLGLGLAFAVDVAKAHGGSLTVGRDGAITKVTIALPATSSLA